jgi:hypothetical protein
MEIDRVTPFRNSPHMGGVRGTYSRHPSSQILKPVFSPEPSPV